MDQTNHIKGTFFQSLTKYISNKQNIIIGG